MSSPLSLSSVDLVLRWRDDHRHVGGLHERSNRSLELGAVRSSVGLTRCSSFSTRSRSLVPVLPHLVVHRTAVALSMESTIALPWKPRPRKWRDEIFGDRLQPVVAGDQVVLAAELALQLFSCLRPSSACFDQLVMSSLRLALSSAARACGSRRRAAPSRRLRPTAGSRRSPRNRRRPRACVSSPAISGVPVKAEKSALGNAERMLSARCRTGCGAPRRSCTMMSRRSQSRLSGVLELVDEREDVAVVAAPAVRAGARRSRRGTRVARSPRRRRRRFWRSARPARPGR